MTPQALTHAELDELAALEAKATPGEWLQEPWYCEEGGWCAMGPHRECDPDSDDELEETDEPGSPCHKRAQADAAYVRALTAAAPALLSMARRLGDVTCQKCKRAFPHNEEMVCMCCNASLVSDACFYENRYVRVGDLTKQLTAATAREDALGSRIMEIADDALGLQEVDSSPIHMLDALEKRFHEHRVEATRAKCADALQATLDEIAHIVGAVHDQMTGPSYPGTNTEVIAAVAAATARAEAAEAELTPEIAERYEDELSTLRATLASVTAERDRDFERGYDQGVCEALSTMSAEDASYCRKKFPTWDKAWKAYLAATPKETEMFGCYSEVTPNYEGATERLVALLADRGIGVRPGLLTLEDGRPVLRDWYFESAVTDWEAVGDLAFEAFGLRPATPKEPR